MRGSRAASAHRTSGRFPSPGTRGSSRSFSSIPFWIPDADRFGARLQRVALVELEGLGAVVLLFLHLAGERLDRGGRHAGEHLGEMGAAAHAAEQLVRLLPETPHQIQADEAPVR